MLTFSQVVLLKLSYRRHLRKKNCSPLIASYCKWTSEDSNWWIRMKNLETEGSKQQVRVTWKKTSAMVNRWYNDDGHFILQGIGLLERATAESTVWFDKREHVYYA